MIQKWAEHVAVISFDRDCFYFDLFDVCCTEDDALIRNA